VNEICFCATREVTSVGQPVWNYCISALGLEMLWAVSRSSGQYFVMTLTHLRVMGKVKPRGLFEDERRSKIKKP
jgi:hypothetical protein